MAFRATQVWIQVLALPLTGGVMLGKSCNSLSLSFLSVQGEHLAKCLVTGNQETPFSHHLATL